MAKIVGKALAPKVRRPAKCPPSVHAQIKGLVEKGAKVNAVYLSAGLQNAEWLAFSNRGTKVVAAGALKNPNAQYRRSVFDKARAKLDPSQFRYEIGYIYVDEASRGHKLSRRLMDALQQRANAEGVYLTTETTNKAIQTFAKELGFVQVGEPYKSQEGNNPLVLLVKPGASEPPRSR